MKDAILGATVLLVEDEPRVACALAHMITKLGYAVLQTNSIDAAQRALAGDATIGVIVADYGMNCDRTGLDLLEWARGAHPIVRRILITGLDVSAVRARIDSTCDDFMSKPFSMEELSELLERQLLMSA